MFGCTCAPRSHSVSSELLYVTSASFSQVTSQGTERAVIAAARSQRPALFRDVRTAVSTRDAVTLMPRLTSSKLTLLRVPCPRGLGRQASSDEPRSRWSACAQSCTHLRSALARLQRGGHGNDRMSRVGQFFFLQHRRHIAASE